MRRGVHSGRRWRKVAEISIEVGPVESSEKANGICRFDGRQRFDSETVVRF